MTIRQGFGHCSFALVQAFTPLSNAKTSLSVPMRVIANTQFHTVEVEVGDFGKTKFLVDTGADTTVLGEWFVEKNKIPTKSTPTEGVDSGGHGFVVRDAEISKLRVGGVSKSIKSVPSVPLPDHFQQNQIAGILSPQSFFVGSEFTLDFRKKRIWIGPGAKPMNAQSLSLVASNLEGQYFINAEILGKLGTFYLDTGASRAAITSRFASQLNLKLAKEASRVGAAGKRSVQRVSGVSIKVGEIEQKLDLDIEGKNVAWTEADGKIGIDFLSDCAIHFDQKRKALTIAR